MAASFRGEAESMIGYLLTTIRVQCNFSKDMMAAAMCLESGAYDLLEHDSQIASNDQRTLVESMCRNLGIAY